MKNLIPHIIHNLDPEDAVSVGRIEQMKEQLIVQGIKEYYLHGAIMTPHSPRGCSQAHKAVIRWAIENKQPEIMVWEDDVYFPAPDGVKYYLSKIPKGEFDIYFGGVNCSYPIKEDGRINQFCGTHCMIIREAFYDKILEANENQNIDLWLHNRGRYYVCYPFAAIQRNGISVMGQNERSWDSHFKNRKIYGLNS